MIYTIENDIIAVQISSLGGELMSIKSKADGTEYLWQGDAAYWNGRAYNLFPIVGRLTEDKYTYKGITYEMNLHGFVRKTELNVIKQAADSITFSLKANDTTMKLYPFDFDYSVTFTIKGAGVETTYNVINNDDKIMPFAVGGHPGFNVPLTKGEKFEDYYLEFDCVKPVKAIVMSPTCYTTRDTEPFYMKDGRIIELRHSLFDNDAIVLSDICTSITLKSKTGMKELRMEFPDMKYLGIWHKPLSDAPYVCIEPWTSLPAYDGEIDDLETKRDMFKLEKGISYKNSFIIKIK